MQIYIYVYVNKTRINNSVFVKVTSALEEIKFSLKQPKTE